MELMMGAPGESPERGTSQQRILSADSLMSLARTKDVEQRVAQPYWCLVHRHGDFDAQELTIESFHFQVIGFGE